MAGLSEAKQEAIRLIGGLTKRKRTAYIISPDPRDNVVGVGIGSKIVNGDLTGEASIRFYVVRKLHPSTISQGLMLPAFVDGIPTDVVETGEFFPAADPLPAPIRERFRPPQPGCSIGIQRPAASLSGTFGAVVERGGTHFLMTNNHVIADDEQESIGSEVLQPGPGDGLGDPIANVTEFAPMRPALSSHLDAAIAELTVPAVGEILPPIGLLASPVPIPAREHMAVQKVGRATSFRTGKVIDVELDIPIPYSFGTVLLLDQILIFNTVEWFANNGDSGALVVEAQSRRATGLVCAIAPCSPVNFFAVANHVHKALDFFQATMVV